MFKMGKNLKTLALKLKPTDELAKDSLWQTNADKENIALRLPSLYINDQPLAKSYLARVHKHKTVES